MRILVWVYLLWVSIIISQVSFLATVETCLTNFAFFLFPIVLSVVSLNNLWFLTLFLLNSSIEALARASLYCVGELFALVASKCLALSS